MVLLKTITNCRVANYLQFWSSTSSYGLVFSVWVPATGHPDWKKLLVFIFLRVSYPGMVKIFSTKTTQIGSGAHPVSYSMSRVAWFQISAAKLLKIALLGVITQRVVIIYYRRFGANYQYHPQSSKDSWILSMWQIGCPETSVRNCYYILRNNPEERSSRGRILSRGKSGLEAMLTNHVYLIPRLRMCSCTSAYPSYLYGVDRNNFKFISA